MVFVYVSDGESKVERRYLQACRRNTSCMWDIITGKHMDGYRGSDEIGDNCVIAGLHTFVGLGLGTISLVTSEGHVKRSPA